MCRFYLFSIVFPSVMGNLQKIDDIFSRQDFHKIYYLLLDVGKLKSNGTKNSKFFIEDHQYFYINLTIVSKKCHLN